MTTKETRNFSKYEEKCAVKHIILMLLIKFITAEALLVLRSVYFSPRFRIKHCLLNYMLVLHYLTLYILNFCIC
jgi:hypothetical protein